MSNGVDPDGSGSGLNDAAVLLETMAVGYVRLARDETITSVNLAGERILGRRAADLIGHDMWERFPGARELDFGRVYDAVMETRVAQTLEAYYPGLATWFDLRIEPVADGGVALYFLDVTARRLAADRLAVLARHSEVLSEISAALTLDLDVAANVGALARMVLPTLGRCSVVSLVDEAGRLYDSGSWHVDPDRRAEAARLAATHVDRDALAAGLGMPAALQVPMVARGRTVGLLTVLGDQPYTAEEVALARDVADRSALAIDNSASFGRARTARAEAEAAGRRLALLAEAGAMLSSSDDLDASVGRLAQLVVPQLADWSIVTLLDAEGQPHNPGWAHRDAAASPDVARYAEYRSTTLHPDAPLAVVLRTGEPVVLTGITRDLVAAAVGERAAGELADVLAPDSAVLAPLASHGRVFGALTLVTTPARGPHTPAEIQTAVEVAARAGSMLESAWSATRAKRLAESVQRSMLTVAAPGEGVHVATRYRPADVDRQVGGDWYDTFRRSDGPTVVTIGDVMGHDVAAISSMAQLRTIMRATGWTPGRTPAEVLRSTDAISADLGPSTYATVVTAEVRPQPDGSAVLRYANAGHLPPAVLEPDGQVTLLRPEVVDPPLGVRPGSPRRTHEARLPPGSTLVLYTDGLIERRGEDLEARLLDLARVLRDLAAESLDTVLDKLLTDLAGVGQRDDVALLALRVGRD